MSRAFALAGAALASLVLVGCQHPENNLAKSAVTPGQLYPLRADAQPDDILLAIHAEGLSPAQDAAVQAAADRWRDSGGQSIMISEPQTPADPAVAYKDVQAVRAHLIAAGVPAAAIQLAGYDSKGDPKAPLKVSFTRYEAEVASCGKNWENLTATEANVVQSNFGCAETANLAAMIADPADLNQPRTDGSADAGRRITVMQSYRKGETTSAASDSKASGAITSAVGGGQ
ncbi:MAG TPA: CpaD family pilus assembly lipoprotein [Caulobacteraceae bacterium]|nr:CpaD family pilus assembly lipoprotein [Caulobacteraceae bacterium]